ncbi:MAG TPA: thiolase family protein [Nitrolancea sp.]
MNEAVVVSAVRSAVGRGKADGSLAVVHPLDLSATVMRAAVKRIGLDAAELDDVYWGCAFPEGSQGLNVARLSLLRAGFPVSVPGATINRFCSSGLQTVAMAAQAVMSGMADVILAGGVEMMSQVPMSGFHTRIHPEMIEPYIGMGFTAERVARRWSISREEQDQYAFESQQKAARAWDEGRYDEQIVPISNGNGEKPPFARDETIRPETTVERLAKLRPAFNVKGTVTAGNSSPFSDGSAALIIMSREKADQLGLKPLARFITFAVAGVEPDVMGIGPAVAVPKALKRAGLSLDDIKLIEFNEAFSAQVLAVVRELDLPADILNVNGGAIALGHPLGATGAKLTTSLIHELRSRGGGIGLVTMCVGGGMGAAGLFEVFAA